MRTDVLAAVVVALAPGAYALLGQSIPDTLPLLISALIGVTVGGSLILRLVAAPYFIWKDDQKAIARLKEERDEPKRRRREELEARFDDMRAELLRDLLPIIIDLRRANEIPLNASDLIKKYYDRAFIFMHNKDFRAYWATFEDSCLAWQACHEKLRMTELDEHSRCELLRTCTYHIQALHTSVLSMGAYLGMQEGHRDAFNEEMQRAMKVYDVSP